MAKNFIRKIFPSFVLSWYHLGLAALAAFYYGFPSRKMIVIGVTGTNGKSTTVNLIGRILEEAGYKVGLTSSVNFKIGDKEWMNKTGMTMVGRFGLQKMIREMLNAGCEYAVLEVSSEGIKQWRHFGIDFDVAVFTNLEPEHIESHRGFENYRAAKGKLFASLSKSYRKKRFPNKNTDGHGQTPTNTGKQIIKKVSIVNIDDKEAEYFLGFEAEEKYGYSLKISNFQFLISNKFFRRRRIPRGGTISNFQTLIAEHVQVSDDGIKFLVKNTEFDLKLLGEFNIYNALAAICAGLSQGIDLDICKKALEKVKGIPGRMEIVISEPFKVIVDYAHTPEALEKVYKTLEDGQFQQAKRYNKRSPEPREFSGTGRSDTTSEAIQHVRLICVLGSDGGVRDKWKRPKLGEIAAKYCDKIILTDVNPFDEKPSQILSEIESGISPPKADPLQGDNFPKENLFLILDRRKAIRKALTLAGKGDTVIITGKGCEQWIKGPKDSKIPWDDREVAKEEIIKLTQSVIPSEAEGSHKL